MFVGFKCKGALTGPHSCEERGARVGSSDSRKIQAEKGSDIHCYL